MRKNHTSESGLLNPRVLLAFALCSGGGLLAISFAAPTAGSSARSSSGSAVDLPFVNKHSGQVGPGAAYVNTASIGWRLLQSGTPPARESATFVYDAAIGAAVLFGGYRSYNTSPSLPPLADTWTFDGKAWVRVLTAHSPTPRQQASMAYDAAHQVVLLFGGVDNSGTILNDTWSFNGIDWTQLMPINSPSPRFWASIAFDAAHNQIVLFGGSPAQNATNLDNDTWTWDGTNWTQQLLTLPPPPRYGAPMAYDPDAQKVVLFGGGDPSSPSLGHGLNDTWEWDGSTWSPFVNANPNANPPPGRYGAVMDYDATLKRLVLFGGSSTDRGNMYLNDTWTWDQSNGWQAISPTSSPSVRAFMDGAYDVRTSRLYITHGDPASSIDTDETWSWDGSTWTQITFLNIPPGRRYAAFGYDLTHDEYVLFGGLFEGGGRAFYLNDTWIWKDGSWAQAQPPNSPSARWLASLAYDPGSSKLVLFGGCAGDTWTWDGTNWTQEAPTTPPPSLWAAALASDPAASNVLMFGGYNCSTSSVVNSTWTYSQGQWTQLNPGSGPSARMAAALAYDRLGGLVLFGGFVNGGPGTELGDTWSWDGTSWSGQFSATAPTARSFATMALDNVGSGHPVLFGGYQGIFGQQQFGDTWTWMESGGWAQQTPAVSPEPRIGQAMAPAGSSSPALLFGGSSRNDLWGFGPPPPVQLTGVVSRKTHGSAGDFDIDLPLTGSPGIECRGGGATGDYTLVFSFANPLTNVGEASVTSGTGSVASKTIDTTDAHNYIVNLTGVTNVQVITVGLSNVTDSVGNFSDIVSLSMGILLGDVNASGRVDAADVSLVRQQTLQPITSSNFREDINASGRIDAADVSIARQQTLTSLP